MSLNFSRLGKKSTSLLQTILTSKVFTNEQNNDYIILEESIPPNMSKSDIGQLKVHLKNLKKAKCIDGFTCFFMGETLVFITVYLKK
jgi:hypothetical protein